MRLLGKLFLFFLVFVIFSGCSSKTVYNQKSGEYLDSEILMKDLNKKEINTRNFQREKMNDFYNFADRVYSSIEQKIEETKQYSLTGRLLRDEIIYKQKEAR